MTVAQGMADALVATLPRIAGALGVSAALVTLLPKTARPEQQVDAEPVAVIG